MMNDHELDEMAIVRNAWRIAKLDREKYELQNAELLGRLNKLTEALSEAMKACERARAIAAMLENECANCWGPVHRFPINEARLQAQYRYTTSKAADDGA